MTIKDRMVAALQREPVDRIPAATYNFHPFGKHSTEPGYTHLLKVLNESENVGILCKVNAEETGRFNNLFSQETKREGDKKIITSRAETPKGELRSVYAEPDNQPGYTVEHLIKGDGDIERYLSLPNTPASRDMSPVKTVREKLGDKGLVYIGYDDPFYAVSRRFNFEDFTIRCITEELLIKELVVREFDRIKAELTEMVQQSAGMEVLFYTAGPEIATPPFFSPDIFKKFITPYQKELVRIIKDAGQLSSIHSHGNVGTLFDEFFEIGADVLEPLEPLPQGDINLEEALAISEDRMCLMGYMQDQEFYTLTTDEIEKKIEDIRRIVGGRTGFIMTPTCTPFMFPPSKRFVENYEQFLRSANCM